MNQANHQRADTSHQVAHGLLTIAIRKDHTNETTYPKDCDKGSTCKGFHHYQKTLVQETSGF